MLLIKVNHDIRLGNQTSVCISFVLLHSAASLKEDVGGVSNGSQLTDTATNSAAGFVCGHIHSEHERPIFTSGTFFFRPGIFCGTWFFCVSTVGIRGWIQFLGGFCSAEHCWLSNVQSFTHPGLLKTLCKLKVIHTFLISEQISLLHLPGVWPRCRNADYSSPHGWYRNTTMGCHKVLEGWLVESIPLCVFFTVL